jgi:hypothetical protein
MQIGRKTNMNTRQPGRTASFAARSKRWSSNAPRPEQGALTTRKETMSGIWRLLKLKLKAATQSGQKTTISTPSIISDRCHLAEERHRRLCFNGLCY